MSRSAAGICLAALIGLLTLPQARAEPSAAARTEISYLLATVGQSDCLFFRNGSWYDAKQAEQHLRLKYDALVARDLIGSAEDFIARGATYSSFSGLAYAIRCSGDAQVPAAAWLTDRLAQYRRSRQ